MAKAKVKPIMTDSEALRRIAEPIFGMRGNDEEKARIFLSRVKGAGLEEIMAQFALARCKDLMPENKAPSRFGLSRKIEVVPNETRVSTTAASFIRRTIYETLTIRDRPIGEIRFCDIDGLVNTNAYETGLLKAIKDQFVPANPTATIQEVVPMKKLTELDGMMRKKFDRIS